MKQTLLLQLYKPYLTPIDADEIRAEGFALKPKICFVMADWPWIELRGITEKQVGEFLEGLEKRGVKYRMLEAGKRSVKAQVQVSETKEVC
jgi:hypothetical protein